MLADDDVLLREGLASLLESSGFDVVGQAGDGVELLAIVRSTRPDVAIVVLSAHVEVDEAMDLLAGGERLGYLLKTRVTDVAEFIGTIERIVAGAAVVDPALVRELVSAR
ncbi:MAG TPA: hypothetical protein VKC59_01230, partial [Candidatus Limnocylindrales bacterium]|nr:hypothetical protein [Candidatus Limnocylindrales bacterium]